MTSALHDLVMCHRRARASGQTHAVLAGAVAWAAGAPGGALLRILVGSRVHTQHVFARLAGLAPPATRYVHARTEAVFPGGAAVRVANLAAWEMDGAGAAGPVLLDATAIEALAVEALAALEADREQSALLLDARDEALREARKGVARAERERDEARAEGDEIKRRVGNTLSRWGAEDFDDVCDALDALVDESEQHEREMQEMANLLSVQRDEARAEVERLRAKLHRCASCGTDESAVAVDAGDQYPVCGPCGAVLIGEGAAEEREACAVACDSIATSCREMQASHASAGRQREAAEAWEMAGVADDCAEAIRARGKGGAVRSQHAPATPCRWTPHGQRVLDCTGAEVNLPPSTPFVPFGEALTAMRAVVPDLLTPVVVLPETPCARALAAAAEGFDLEGLAAGRVQMAHGFARFPDGAWRQVCVWERTAPRDGAS